MRSKAEQSLVGRTQKKTTPATGTTNTIRYTIIHERLPCPFARTRRVLCCNLALNQYQVKGRSVVVVWTVDNASKSETQVHRWRLKSLKGFTYVESWALLLLTLLDVTTSRLLFLPMPWSTNIGLLTQSWNQVNKRRSRLVIQFTLLSWFNSFLIG